MTNLVVLLGNMTKDVEVKTSGEHTFGKGTIAVPRKFKREGQPEADFFNFTVFGKQAEFAGKYLTKGTKVMLTGSIQNDNYEKDGVKHYGVQLMVDSIEFAGSKKDSDSAAAQQPTQQNPANSGFMNIPDGIDDELPFA